MYYNYNALYAIVWMIFHSTYIKAWYPAKILRNWPASTKCCLLFIYSVFHRHWSGVKRRTAKGVLKSGFKVLFLSFEAIFKCQYYWPEVAKISTKVLTGILARLHVSPNGFCLCLLSFMHSFYVTFTNTKAYYIGLGGVCNVRNADSSGRKAQSGWILVL